MQVTRTTGMSLKTVDNAMAVGAVGGNERMDCLWEESEPVPQEVLGVTPPERHWTDDLCSKETRRTRPASTTPLSEQQTVATA